MTTANVTEAVAPTLLAELAALLDRYPDRDCPADAVAELLDDVSSVLRRARAKLRRATRKDEPVGKPAAADPEPAPSSPPRVAAAATPRPPTSTASAKPAPARPEQQPEKATAPVRPPQPAPAPATTPSVPAPARPDSATTHTPKLGALLVGARQRWRPLVGLLAVVVVLLALLVHPAALAAAALPAAIYAATVHRAPTPLDAHHRSPAG